MISNELDLAPWHARLRQDGCVQIREFLQPSAALRLRRCLEHETMWTVAQREDLVVEGQSPPPGLDGALLQSAYRRARDGFEFVFDRQAIGGAAHGGPDPNPLLLAVLEFLNSQEFLSFARVLTGDDGIRLVTAMAVRYRPGHFLSAHDDSAEGKERAFAYVINLGRDWRPDWGGLLQFVDENHEVVQTFVPHWNSLSLFRVPRMHQVSLVSPWAGDDRYSITGWFRH